MPRVREIEEPAELLALVYLRVALINGCPFWIDINASRGMQAGASEAMTVTGQKVRDALFAGLRRSFSEPAIVELTAAALLENFRSKFNVALGIEAQGFCVLR